MSLSRYFFLRIILLGLILTISGQRLTAEIGFDFRPSYVFPSFRDDILRETLNMENAVDSRFATSLHLKYGFTLRPDSRTGSLWPGVCQGLGTSVTLFEHPSSIGVPVSLYLFQGAPVCRFNRHLTLDYEWNFGVSAGWRACKGESCRSNLITGSEVNAHINLGVGVRWILNRSMAITAGVDLTHFSNGNTSFPNPDINLVGLRVGIIHSPEGPRERIPFKTVSPEENDSTHEDREDALGFDLTGYGAWRKRVYRGGEAPVLLKGNFAVAGLTFAPMWKIKRYFRAGVSADFQWDQSTDLRRHHVSGSSTADICFSTPPFFRQVSVGVSARAELVMPFFSVNVGIGYNFLGPEESRATYQMANLKISLTRSLFLNIGYQLQNFQRQNNLMLGLCYSFRYQAPTPFLDI